MGDLPVSQWRGPYGYFVDWGVRGGGSSPLIVHQQTCAQPSVEVREGPYADINFDVAVVDASEAATSAARNAGSASGKPVRRLSADKVEFARLKPGEVRRS
jgi:hypothetical protein